MQHIAPHQGKDEKLYDMRWRFDYANGIVKYGKWSSPGNRPEHQAWCQNREGLLRASVEGKNRFNPEDHRPLAECDGHDFVNFQWVAQALCPASLKGLGQPAHQLMGMKLVTRDNEYWCFPDGTIDCKDRPESDKSFHYATFGR